MGRFAKVSLYDDPMILSFLGTGGAWSLPELNCDCLTCREMRQRKERRQRTSLLLSGETNVLIDCGPDVADQLARHGVEGLGAVLITHEHGDHYIGLDELFSFKRTLPKGEFEPIPLYLTEETWRIIQARFGYLVEMGVIAVHPVEPGRTYTFGEFEFIPFKTNHGSFASGSVGYVIRTADRNGEEVRVSYTSDYFDLPASPPELVHPDYLVIQSFWFHEPVKNIPQHMSFQRALEYIKRWQPKKETFLVHIGDGDAIPGDPANGMLKKNKAIDPLCCPEDGKPYDAPLCQEQWQERVDQIVSDLHLPYKITVARDGLQIPF